MEIEEKIKPNSEECLRHDEFSYWSHLPSDCLISVFERLDFADFQRAKSVCSSWHSVSKQSLPSKNQIPWLILFPGEDSNNSFCTLFNPEDKTKLYQTQDLGVDFTKSVCLATCGCWLFMRDPRYNLFLLNLLTNERINLPPVESLRGRIKIERTLDDGFLVTNFLESKNLSIRSPLLWIDENTKDYAVLWGVGTQCVVHSKKGDRFWSQIEKISSCIPMVYKDHKLYIFSRSNDFRIFDFSGEVPQEIAQCTMIMYKVNGKYYPACLQYYTILETTLVVTLTGDVLRVNRVLRKPRCRCRTWLFHVYKVYSSGVLMEIHEQVHSLGDEAIVLDLGITVLANNLRGFRRNCIYFPPAYRSKYPYEVFIYNMETKKKEKLHIFDCSTARLFTARWFLPRVTQT